jgi:hypothetical protein
MRDRVLTEPELTDEEIAAGVEQPGDEIVAVCSRQTIAGIVAVPGLLADLLDAMEEAPAAGSFAAVERLIVQNGLPPPWRPNEPIGRTEE